jgi:hypothetical protein
MSYGRGYYDEGRAQDAMAVVAKWMSGRHDLKVQFHGGDAVDADIFKGVIRIPRLACSGGLTDESIGLLRHRVYHEAGHISETKLAKGEYPQGVLFQILNCIEDRRMERAVSDRYLGAGPVFDFAHHYYNRKIAEKMAAGEVTAPLWEGLVAMALQSEGVPPEWRLSEKAKLYFDAAYDKFCEWKGLRDAQGSLALAKEVYDILKEAHEQSKSSGEPGGDEGQGQGDSGEGEQGEGEQGQGDSGEGDSGEGEQGEQGEGESGSCERDFDDEEEGSEKGAEGEESDARLEEELAEEAAGKDLSEYEDEDIAKALGELDLLDAGYLARRDLDEHNYVQGDEGDMEQYKSDREQVAAGVAALVRAMEQALRSRSRCRKDPFQRRGKIDNGRLVHIAKNLSKEVFYRTRQGEEMETAVEIVIDESGSMGAKCVPVRRVAIAVAEALTQLNIPFEVTGTTTKFCGAEAPADGLDRTNPLVYNHYKTFDQQWHQVKHGISRTGSHNNNADGEAVEWCARRLLARRESRKVILSLSDGEPYAGHPNKSKMESNLVRSCERAREAGVEVYGFGIETEAPRKFYGEKNFVYLPGGSIDLEFAKSFVEILMKGRLS